MHQRQSALRSERRKTTVVRSLKEKRSPGTENARVTVKFIFSCLQKSAREQDYKHRVRAFHRGLFSKNYHQFWCQNLKKMQKFPCEFRFLELFRVDDVSVIGTW